MKFFKGLYAIILAVFCLSTVTTNAQISWDFENGADHSFRLWSTSPATPADDNPDIAGDEAITGVGGDNGLPDAGIAWTIGPPNQFDGLEPAVDEGDHVVGGVLQYNDSNDPFGAYRDGPIAQYENLRGQSGYLNTYNLNQWGDHLHSESNIQIATSPAVELGSDAQLYVWSLGGGGDMAPQPAANREAGYLPGSCGIAVLSAADSSLLANIYTHNTGHYEDMGDTLDLSDYAGETVVIEVVDAFEGSYGWLSVDEIQISSATATGIQDDPATAPVQFELTQNYPNPFNPTTTIRFNLPESGIYSLRVYNAVGQEVSILLQGNMPAGNHSVNFDASALPSGMYIYQLSGQNTTLTKKMVLMR